ncbi:hypothetical protein AAYR18_02990 [Leuconostoc fallax]|uniref:hypothetical protein n=1 Tax=Leuconostoc fallax TaxID=1251 RepID=UPI002091BCDC|nr:hypothetical protein [Leuconostoc fallax]MCO6183647.1 hypothetical protein [Leuconostoc fallax]
MVISTLYVVIFSILSALSRGIITVIDRYQMGYRKSSVFTVNFFNNLLSMLLVTVVLIIMTMQHRLALNITPWLLVRIIIYASLVQAVAFGYSALFRQVTVMDSVLLSKLTDFVIPIAIFITTYYFNWHSYFISVVSTILVIGLFLLSVRTNNSSTKILIKNFWLIGPFLILQAALSPVLVADIKTPEALITFTILTIYLRFLITLTAFLRQRHQANMIREQVGSRVMMLYGTRAVLTLVAQLTFTLATSSQTSSIAWVFLNMTSLFSIILSGFFLREKVDLKSFGVILIIIVLGIVSNFV